MKILIFTNDCFINYYSLSDVTLDAIDAKIEDTFDDADLIVIKILSATQ